MRGHDTDKAYNVRSRPDYKLDTGQNHRKSRQKAQDPDPVVQCHKPCHFHGLCPSAHALSLNDICDSLSNHAGTLKQIRGCTPPSRNGLSHANKTRGADMAVSKEKRQNVSINVSINVRINRTQGRILQCLLGKPDITSKTLAERLELSPRTIARAFQYLQQTNIIQRTGSRKNGSWLVVKGE